MTEATAAATPSSSLAASAAAAAAAAMSPTDAITLAVKALEGCAAIVPSSASEVDASDDEEDEGQTTAPLFVKKLKALVDDPEVDSTVWSDDGASFVIHEPKRLSEQLVKYFKSSKLKSFVRQLHFYGFKKIGGSRYADWVYNHKYFQQHGRLLHRLRRKTCGPDQQIKNLQTKVQSLQGSLVTTQQKLGDMATALVALLRHTQANGGNCCSTNGGGDGGGGCGSSSGGGGAGAGTMVVQQRQQYQQHQQRQQQQQQQQQHRHQPNAGCFFAAATTLDW